MNTQADGTRIYCQFDVPKQLIFNTSSSSDVVDMNNPTYLMLAYGPTSSQGWFDNFFLFEIKLYISLFITPFNFNAFLFEGRLQKHAVQPLATSTPIQMSALDTVKSANRDLLKAHGIVHLRTNS